MNKITTTYNNLPERIDEILSELMEVKKLLGYPQQSKAESRFLDIDNAIVYLKDNGIQISKSTLYKKCTSGLIISHKIENRLYFKPVELLNSIIK